MNTYNKIMLYFWLFVAVMLFIVVSYMSFTEGFKKWAFYYVFVFLAFFAFIVRRWLMKRMARVEQEIAERKEKEA